MLLLQESESQLWGRSAEPERNRLPARRGEVSLFLGLLCLESPRGNRPPRPRPFRGAHSAREHVGISAEAYGKERGFLCPVPWPVGSDAPFPTAPAHLWCPRRTAGTLRHPWWCPMDGTGPRGLHPPPALCPPLPATLQVGPSPRRCPWLSAGRCAQEPDKTEAEFDGADDRRERDGGHTTPSRTESSRE